MSNHNIRPYIIGFLVGLFIMAIPFALVLILTPRIDYSLQQYSTWDDFGLDTKEDYSEEEAEWEYISDNIWKDTRTGLSWSTDQGAMTNIFDSNCEYFSSSPRSLYDGSDGKCGEAINYCSKLNLDGKDNWYLPSQKELMQAYIDGIGSQTGDTYEKAREFSEGEHYYFWSSSEASHWDEFVWFMYLGQGLSDTYFKTHNEYGVRCVSRD